MKLDDEIRELLKRRGWKIDEAAVENRSGELCEFIHPDTGVKLAWIDALIEEGAREYRKGSQL